jgi:hypothetical protein
MRLIASLFMVIILTCVCYGYDLKSIEDSFIDNGKADLYVVVSDKGNSYDVVAQSEIVKYLDEYTDTPLLGVAKLSSEIDDIYEKDIISIGNPCVNEVTKHIMDYDDDCDIEEGLVRFYQKNGKTQLVIYGASDKSTRKAAQDIVDKKISGEEIKIELTAEELEERKKRMQEELLKKIEEQKKKANETQEKEEVINETEEIEEEKEETTDDEVIEKTDNDQGFFTAIINFFRGLFGR